MPGERYFTARDSLLGCCRRIDTLAKESGLTGGEDRARAYKKLARPLRIVVLGEVNSGKSMLFNALVGCELCPAGPLPSTQQTGWYRYAETESNLKRKDGWVEARRPVEFLRHFELIDTPGTNSGWRDQVFSDLSRFQMADLLLVVFPVLNTWTAATWELVSALDDEALEKTLLVVQRSDEKTADDLKVIRGHMKELCVKRVGRELPIFAVAAQLAYEAKVNPTTERKGWSASGFLAFEQYLSEQVCYSAQRRHLLHRTSQEAARHLREIEEGFDRQRRGMDDDGWFLTGLEREADQLRDMVLEALPKTLAGARGRYEAEVGSLGKLLGRSLGATRTLARLFLGDSTPARIEAGFATSLQETIRGFAALDAARLLEECDGHWNDVRPRVIERMGMDPGGAMLSGEEQGQGVAVEKFTNRVGRAVTVVLGQLRVRALLDASVRNRNQRMKGLVAVVLLLLTAAGVCGALGYDPVAYGLSAGAAVLAGMTVLAMWISRRALVNGVRRRLLDSVGQFEAALAGDYSEAVRVLFRDYSNSLIRVRRQLAQRKETLEPRVERWNDLYLELKSIEQEME